MERRNCINRNKYSSFIYSIMYYVLAQYSSLKRVTLRTSTDELNIQSFWYCQRITKNAVADRWRDICGRNDCDYSVDEVSTEWMGYVLECFAKKVGKAYVPYQVKSIPRTKNVFLVVRRSRWISFILCHLNHRNFVRRTTFDMYLWRVRHWHWRMSGWNVFLHLSGKIISSSGDNEIWLFASTLLESCRLWRFKWQYLSIRIWEI